MIQLILERGLFANQERCAHRLPPHSWVNRPDTSFTVFRGHPLQFNFLTFPITDVYFLHPLFAEVDIKNTIFISFFYCHVLASEGFTNAKYMTMKIDLAGNIDFPQQLTRFVGYWWQLLGEWLQTRTISVSRRIHL